MTNPRTLVVVGASLAGAKAAMAARSIGFDGRVLLVGDEPGLPYERPSLSKDFLRGDKDASAVLVTDADTYLEHGIELVHDRATALDPTARTVDLGGGDHAADLVAQLPDVSRPRVDDQVLHQVVGHADASLAEFV